MPLAVRGDGECGLPFTAFPCVFTILSLSACPCVFTAFHCLQVWEGYNTTKPVSLKAGKATITLETVKDCADCNYGNRNIDVVLLHPLASDIEMRVHTPPEDSLLPLDGLFSQYGEIFFKVQNFNKASLLLEVPISYNHATYFAQHLHNVGDPYTAP